MADEFTRPPDEPVPEAERTVVRPRPGARSLPSSPPAFDAAASQAEDSDLRWSPDSARNPLLACAQPLLTLVSQLRTTAVQPDPARLRDSLTDGVRAFENAAHQAGIPRDTIVASRYVLCTFLDETASGTPWGSGGVWARDPLLVRFHNETWGGEKVFVLLSKLAEDPARNRNLLELVYVSLALGFRGRYGAMADGPTQLAQIRERLYRMLRDLQPEPDRALSQNWAPASIRRRHWAAAAPFWAFCALAGIIALGVYTTYSMLLAARSDPVFASVQAIRLPNVTPPQPAPPPPVAPAPPKRLAGFLESEIRDGLVAVRDEGGRSVVSILGDGFFPPGSASVPAARRPLLDRIAKALEANPGQVLVSGHTDSVPIRSARFPSNWELSRERAQAVERILAESIGADRLRAEGRADSEPVAPNDTAAGRARNRRVEVTLFVSPR